MISHVLLRKAFRSKLFAAVGKNYSNVFLAEGRLDGRTDPSPEGYWIYETLIPSTERKIAIKTVEALGRMEYAIVVNEGTGTEIAEGVADDIAELFEPDTSLTFEGGTFANVYRTERLAKRRLGEGLVAYPISMSWRYFSSAST